MNTKIIEVTNGGNWGKFLLGRFDAAWKRRSLVDAGVPLLRRLGWSPEHLWVLDLQTGEGACLLPGGLPSSDLNKHRVWVCPMFEPFLMWLYRQDLSELDQLPDLLERPDAPFELWGYRPPGPETEGGEDSARCGSGRTGGGNDAIPAQRSGNPSPLAADEPGTGQNPRRPA